MTDEPFVGGGGKSHSNLEDLLYDFVSEPTDRLVLIAPFIKKATMGRLLARVGSDVEVDCYTRWEAAEVACGVSDPSIIDFMASYRSFKIHLVDRLHTKIYANSSECLVGSANLTGRALGVVAPPNHELLVRLPRNYPGVEQSIGEIVAASRRALPEDAANVTRLAQLLKDVVVVQSSNSEEGVSWFPESPSPVNVFRVYNGLDASMSETAKNAVIRDIAALGLPPGLDESEFKKHVASTLYALPVMASLKETGSLSQQDMEEYLSHAGIEGPGGIASNIARWMVYVDEDCRSETSTFRLVLRKAVGS